MSVGKSSGFKDVVGAAVLAGLAKADQGLAAVGQSVGMTFVAGSAKEIAKSIFDMLPDARFAEAVKAERAQELEANRERLEKNVAMLVEAHGEQAGLLQNIAAVVEGWAKARRTTAESRKARLLMAALVNAFDPAIYIDGLTVSLLQILERLDYGDLWVLNGTKDNMSDSVRKAFAVETGVVSINPTSMLHWHLGRLIDVKLVRSKIDRGDESFVVGGTRRTALGDRLIRLIGEGAFNEAL